MKARMYFRYQTTRNYADRLQPAKHPATVTDNVSEDYTHCSW